MKQNFKNIFSWILFKIHGLYAGTSHFIFPFKFLWRGLINYGKTTAGRGVLNMGLCFSNVKSVSYVLIMWKFFIMFSRRRGFELYVQESITWGENIAL